MSGLKKNTFVRYVGGRKKTYEVRRESNDEILHRTVLLGQPICLRVLVQIRHPEAGGRYVGWQGLSLKKRVDTIEQAREFVAQIRKLIGEEDHGNDNGTGKTRH